MANIPFYTCPFDQIFGVSSPRRVAWLPRSAGLSKPGHLEATALHKAVRPMSEAEVRCNHPPCMSESLSVDMAQRR